MLRRACKKRKPLEGNSFSFFPLCFNVAQKTSPQHASCSCRLCSLKDFMQKCVHTDVDVCDNESCKHEINCARATSTRKGALSDVDGVVGTTCVHGYPIPESYCDLRGPENYTYYMVRLSRQVTQVLCPSYPICAQLIINASSFLQLILMFIAKMCPQVTRIYIDFGCRLSISWRNFLNALKVGSCLFGLPPGKSSANQLSKSQPHS